MYAPFESAIDQYREGQHVQPLAVFEHRLTVCDTCKQRTELGCRACAKCGNRSLIRWAERLTTDCPRRKW